MKTTRLISTILATAFICGSAIAQDALKETAILANLKQKYPSTVIKSVTATHLPGIYEVVMGKNVADSRNPG